MEREIDEPTPPLFNTPRPRARGRRRSRAIEPSSLPTPEMIRDMTEAIQKAWTPRELRRRARMTYRYTIVQMPLEPRRKGFWGD